MRRLLLSQAVAVLLTGISLPAMAQSDSPQLRAAYEQYAAARIAMSQTETGSVEAVAQTEAAIAARANLVALCTDLGAPDLAACFDQFIPAEMRVPNDTQAIAPVEAPVEAPAPPEAPAPQAPAEPIKQEPAPEPAEPPAVDAAPEPAPAEAAPQPEPKPVEAAPAAEPEKQPEAEMKTDAETKTEVEASAEPAPKEPVEEIKDADAPKAEVAPLLDSAKDADAEEKSGKRKKRPNGNQPDQPVAEQPAEPAPKSDEEAQANAQPQEIQSVEAEKGEQVIETQEVRRDRQRSAPKGAKAVEEQSDNGGFRIVFQFGDQLVVESDDSGRLSRGGSERTVENLRRGRTRETITRPNGARVVTIYNRNGDILRRSRFTPDGREFVLVYVDEDRQNDLLEWRDPGRNLPPLRLNIPARDYVLDADDADENTVTRFLNQPPVENVRRLYSVDEVKRSARIRDSVRRLEIGGLTFETGKATIAPNQVNALSSVANAMLDLLDDNPAETFLIEGHTDAVGSDVSNLALSDRRAETVAVVLSEVFGIPPENLATQGYGERFLKVRTEAAERLNRRVTIRRITPLIAPVARR